MLDVEYYKEIEEELFDMVNIIIYKYSWLSTINGIRILYWYLIR